jgi:hypothetical protein
LAAAITSPEKIWSGVLYVEFMSGLAEEGLLTMGGGWETRGLEGLSPPPPAPVC